MTRSAFHLDVGGVPVLAFAHVPDRPNGLGVVVCSPWGWEEVASYRARRAWADRLAAAGANVLRIDLPGTGDSGGDPADGDQVPGWIAAIVAAAQWQRAQPGIHRIAALGLGLGGLLALEASARGAPIDEAVLWAVHATGRRFVRTQKAFAATQTSRFSLDPAVREPELLPSGWLEVNGFVLTEDTVESLLALGVPDLETGTLTRALVLDQDGITSGSLVGELVSAGVDVATGDGHGWSDLVGHPERSTLAEPVVASVQHWLDHGALGPSDRVPASDPAAAAALIVDTDSSTETAVSIDVGEGQLFAIATDAGPGASVAVVFFNAGAVRRIGPNRLWVTAARRLAAGGIPSLRVDLEDIGDAFGAPSHPPDVGALYSEHRRHQVAAAIEEVVHRWPAAAIVTVGLCAGGYWAFQAALSDERVRAAALLNPGALVWDAGTAELYQARKLAKLRDPVWVRRLLRGKVRGEVIGRAARSALRRLIQRPRHVGGEPRATSIERCFEDIERAGQRVTLAFSAEEPAYDELVRIGAVDRLVSMPGVDLRTLPGRDHTLRPLVAQYEALAVIDETVRGTTAPNCDRDEP